MSRQLSALNVVLIFSVMLLMGFGVVVGYSPELLPPSVATPVEWLTGMLPTELTIIGVGILLGLIGLGGSWVWRTKHHTAALADLPAEEPDCDVAVTGQQLTRHFEIKRDGRYTPQETPIETALREVVVGIYRSKFDDETQAERYVDRGAWTDDRMAAATLTATESVDFPALYRLYAWLYPEHAYAYRIRRSLRVVEDTGSEQLSTYSAAERSTSLGGRLWALLWSDTDGERR